MEKRNPIFGEEWSNKESISISEAKPKGLRLNPKERLHIGSTVGSENEKRMPIFRNFRS